MAYTDVNFKSKKALKDALKEGKAVTVYNPGMGGDLSNFTGKVSLEGPHYPEPHKWYGDATVVNGRVTKVS